MACTYKQPHNLLFSDRDIFHLILPVVIELFLTHLVGLADSIIIATVGESAVSGVSLIDFIMTLLTNIFTALASGGAVVVGQYLGRQNSDRAVFSANQLMGISAAIGFVITACLYVFHVPILKGLFGAVEADVYRHARVYMIVVFASIPFLAVYNAQAAVFRTYGDSATPMKIMFAMNILNLVGNILLVLGLGLETIGVAIPTLVSRIGALLLIVRASKKKADFPVYSLHNIVHPEKETSCKILRIGIPYGFENGIFYFGRLLVASLIATFGTPAIAANSVAQTIVAFVIIPGKAIGISLTTIMSRCLGYGDVAQAKYYSKRIFALIYLVQLVVCSCCIGILPYVLDIYSLSVQATEWASWMVVSHAVLMVIWPLSNTLPIIFRSAGDAKFPMCVSISTMLVCRLVLAYILGISLGFGVVGTWIAMYIDWVVKSVIFCVHYKREKWLRARVL